MGLESGIGSIGSGLFNLYGENDPYSAAEGYYNKIPGMLNQQYSPWINAGQSVLPGMEQYMNRGNQAGSQLMGDYNQMTNDPSGLLNKLGSGFHQSPGYGFQTSQALNAANRASAAGGMAGSPEEQQQIAGITNQLANQDYYNYLNHSQQMYGMGIEGLQGTERLGGMAGSDIYNQGAGAANSLAQNLGEAYMNQGNLKMAQTQYNNQRKGQAYGQIWGGINNIFNPGGSYTGGSGWGGSQGGGGGSSGGGGSLFSSLGSMFGGSGKSGAGSSTGGYQHEPDSGDWEGNGGYSQSGGGGSGSGMNTQELGEIASLAMLLF